MPGDFGEGSARDDWGGVDPLAPSVANGQITPEQWAQYQARRRRDAILGSLLTVGGMLGAQPLANAAGIGATGAGSVATGGGAASGALPPIAGGAPWAVTPYATTATMAGTGAGAGLGAAGAGGAGMFAGLSGRDLMALGLSGAGAIGGAMSKPQNFNANTATQDPNLQRLLATMQGRLDKSEPLYDSIMAMANGLLPTQYQKGGGGMR